MKQSLEQIWLNVFYANDTFDIALLHGSKELGSKHRRAGSEHAPVCTDDLTADLKHHGSAVVALEELAEVLAQVAWGHGDVGHRVVGGTAPVYDNDVAPGAPF